MQATKDLLTVTESSDQVEGHISQSGGVVEEEMEELDLTKPVNPCAKMIEEREERRWSKRIMRITEEAKKNEATGETKNAEGTDKSSNSFFVLSDMEIIDRSANMGVILDGSNWENINIITELEIARQTLYNKEIAMALHTKENDIKERTNINDIESEDNDNESEKDMNKGSTSDSDGFTLILPKRERKSVNRLSLSGKNNQKTGKEKGRRRRDSLNPLDLYTNKRK
jgi:hypothetical protein